MPYPRFRPLLMLLILIITASGVADGPQTADHIGARIRDHYETLLPSLPPAQQRHYALRLYRLTGDPVYIPPVRAEVLGIQTRWRQAMAGLDNPDYRRQRATELVDDYRDDTLKYQRRKALLRDSGELPFAKQLLFRVNQLHELGLAGTPAFQDTDRALKYLRGVEFDAFILDPEVIRVYSAQTANMVYYLHHLGIRDLRDRYQHAFRQVYPPATRHQGLDLQEKVYGMTHLIIAASGYYQNPVSRRDFPWIYDYFERQADHIILGTKPDVYTEVALCFLLADEPDNPMINKVKAALNQAFDDEANMIPSTRQGTDPARGEHRNALVVMLYHWPKRLHPGPDLSRSPAAPSPERRETPKVHLPGQPLIGLAEKIPRPSVHYNSENLLIRQ